MTVAEYDTYINTIDVVEQIEEDVLKDSKTKRCCFYSLELIKIGLEYMKHIKHNIKSNATKKNKDD